ncbi:hypothetical protein MMC07_001850 [Pseudocyphellaria aurata]|nr:hypothetical protein [Pseudocyphellaria aurata]
MEAGNKLRGFRLLYSESHHLVWAQSFGNSKEDSVRRLCDKQRPTVPPNEQTSSALRVGNIRIRVLSPLEAIAEYEKQSRLPHNWINYAISRSAPNGSWQSLERGEIELNEDFFKGFQADLQNKDAWRDFHLGFQDGKRKVRDVANPTQLGDPVSHKAVRVTASSEDAKSISRLSPSLHNYSDSSPTTNSIPKKPPISEVALPTIPPIDATRLFWSMMSYSRTPDPYMFPALQVLSNSHLFILGALSNTVLFPPGHPFRLPIIPDIRPLFDVFVASAEVGLRKPQPEIYELALAKIDAHDKESGGEGIKMAEILFLDDIGENLKTARQLGMRTLRVRLGETWRAVKELEGLLGMELMDEKARKSKL